VDITDPPPEERAAAASEDERLQAAWLDWTHTNLGADPDRANAAATAAREAMHGGKGINAAYEAARLAYGPQHSGVDQTVMLSEPATLRNRLAAWQAAGIIDAATATRIDDFEKSRPITEREPGISVSEVISYIGTVVLLVGVGFLYGTEYQALGSPGRLVVIGLVVAAGLAAGELVSRVGNAGAARRARAAGWTVAAIAAAIWFSQALIDANFLTQTPSNNYPGAPPDTTGAIMLGAAIGFVIAAFLLWRAGSGLIAVPAAWLVYTAAGEFIAYMRNLSSASSEVSVAVAGVILAILSETITLGHERRWAREILRFAVVLPPTISALALSFNPDGADLEYLAIVFALVAFGLALARASAGYAIAGGIALFIVVNEVGFRHFAQSLGFPVVLIVSGITLFAVAGGLVRLLPRLRRRA
jgi:hypothetical protein